MPRPEGEVRRIRYATPRGNKEDQTVEDRPGNELYPQPAHLIHDEYCRIWESVKSGELENLDKWEKVTGQLMLEHPEYQYFWEIPHAVSMGEVEEILEQERANPDLHLAVEVQVVEQLETVPEVRKAFEAVVKTGKGEHESRHIIGRVFGEMLWDGSRLAMKGRQPNEDFYLRRIRYLAKHPRKVIKEQERKLREDL